MEATLRLLGHPGFDVDVFDADAVSASNVARQRFTRSDIGTNKAVLVVHRINNFYGLNWRAIPKHFVVPGKNEHLTYDLLISAVDLAGFRAALCKAYRGQRTSTLLLDLGNGPDLGQVVLGHLGEPFGGGLRLPNVFDLYPEIGDMEAVDREVPSCSAEEAISRQSWPVNRCAAMLASELLWTLFRHGRIETHGAFFRLNPMTVQPLAIDPDAWAFLGYDPAEERAAA
jgi:PRTRC genetic system ThiF family protein